MMPPLSVGAAIPAYKNVDNLRRALNAISKVAPLLLEHTIVVDDSGDGMVWRALHREYSRVTWLVHEQNMGFGKSATEAVMSCQTDIVILLNDDVELVSDPVPHLQSAFADSQLFAATFRSHHADGTFREGAKRLVWRFGMPRILHNERDQRPRENGVMQSDYAVGGHAAYQRRMFREFGGFDPLFEPFYWEDVDLCLRAKYAGAKTVYLPNCVVTHDGKSAIRDAFKADIIRETVWRNRLLFALRHLPRHQRPLFIASIFFYFVRSIVSGNPIFRRALTAARARWQDFQHDSTRISKPSQSED